MSQEIYARICLFGLVFNREMQMVWLKFGLLTDEINSGRLRVIASTNKLVDIAVSAAKVPSQSDIKAAEIKPAKVPVSSVSYKFGVIPSSIVVDRNTLSARGVSEGYDMFFVGLFVPFYGSNENLPICRFGHLAMMPDEPIPWGSEGKLNLYLMETKAFGGNSGSPAFFTTKKDIAHLTLSKFLNRGASSSQILLAGVVKGYFGDWSQVQMINSAAVPVVRQNTGVAAIVPASYLAEILFSREEKEIRKQQFKMYEPHGYF